MNKRKVPRINYKILHTSGAVELKSQDSSSNHQVTMSNHDEINNSLEIDIRVLIEQVRDVIDENPIVSSSTTAETDRTIQLLEDLRIQLRRKNLQLGNSDLPVDSTLNLIKDYIVTSRDQKAKSRLRHEKEKYDQLRLNEQSIAFSIINIVRQISELKDVFNAHPSEATLEQLLEWKANQHLHLKKFDKIAIEYRELLKTPVLDEERHNDVKRITLRSLPY